MTKCSDAFKTGKNCKEETLDKGKNDRYNTNVLKDTTAFVKERSHMKTYLQPKMDVQFIENDIITRSDGELPIFGGDFDEVLG